MPRVMTQNATPLCVLLTSMFLPMCAHRVLLVRLTLLVMTHRVMTRCVVNVLKIITSLPMSAHPVLLVQLTLLVMMHLGRTQHATTRTRILAKVSVVNLMAATQ